MPKSSQKYYEIQCDGMVGAGHNYGGLSHGNVASAQNAGKIANPQQAALQGLEKMAFIASLGVKQLIIPPYNMPNIPLLQQMVIGVKHDNDHLDDDNILQEMLDEAYEKSPNILSLCYSSAGMWAANMATITPCPDSEGGKLHITPANLISNPHRAQEPEFSYEILQNIFANVPNTVIHPPLTSSLDFADEGAANHMRLCNDYGDGGLEIFVYGRDGQHISDTKPQKYIARQSLKASKNIAQSHNIAEARKVFIKQKPKAIDAGVFHNDVIAMSNKNLLIYHEQAFDDEQQKIADLNDKALKMGIKLNIIYITEDELPLDVAVSSYFFNSQILSLRNGNIVIIAPEECKNTKYIKELFDKLVNNKNNPISDVYYMDLQQSMKNGGGPACLRLRVVVSDEQWQHIPDTVKFSDKLHKKLKQIIKSEYPQEVTSEILRDAKFARHCHKTHSLIHQVLGI